MRSAKEITLCQNLLGSIVKTEKYFIATIFMFLFTVSMAKSEVIPFEIIEKVVDVKSAVECEQVSILMLSELERILGSKKLSPEDKEMLDLARKAADNYSSLKNFYKVEKKQGALIEQISESYKAELSQFSPQKRLDVYTEFCNKKLFALQAAYQSSTTVSAKEKASRDNTANSSSKLTIKGISLGSANKNFCQPVNVIEYDAVVRQCKFVDGLDSVVVDFAFDTNEIVRVQRYQFLGSNTPNAFEILKNAVEFYGAPLQAPGKTLGEQKALWKEGENIALDIRQRWCDDEKRNLPSGYKCGSYGEVIVYDLIDRAKYKRYSEVGEQLFKKQNKSNF
jgi:hypothetical protein